MIRPLAAGDREAAVALWHACGLTRPWNDPHADFSRAAEGPSSAVLGAFEDTTLIGSAMVGHDGHRGWVYYLGVHPEHRQRHLGRALMDACEAWVRERGVPKIEVMVRGDNAATRGFYEALGYGLEDVVVYSRRF
ncbi:GNAT family acetyltransferase [Solirubrobacter sp. CPCC 204708]|uniref:GNAT family acetyltransferase n=1 Tax=Solirubrobacter deserti TaxID=2282478 RepID=A0ABT4RSL4_9ACTN|nr:GNAT family acetyltransferase [Solirubrobacter deserti]MBE2315908.1 GNAT family acetyltransferase [Solirubrobacter deserti]MDA0141588.1 GNAT family acetyltransferase [Solirubrobacter deserti]